MTIINPFQRTQSGGVPLVACAITSPASGATVTEATPVTISGTLSGPVAILQVKVNGVVIGSASIVGATWSYSWTPQSGDVGSRTLGATAISVNGIQANAADVPVTVASAVFNGDFGALAATYSLTANHYVRGDLGVSGTQGTGKALWTNQVGAFGNVVPVGSGATNGIGSVGAGLNSKASLVQDGSTHGAKYTTTARAIASTTNRHKYWVFRLLAIPGPSSYAINGDQGDGMCATVAGTANWTNGDDEPATTGCVINQWYRGRLSYTGGTVGGSGGTGDHFRIGSHEPAAWGTANGAALSSGNNFLGCYNDLGQLKVNVEWLLSMEIQGTLANFLAFAADADTKARAFWTSAIEI